MQVSRVGIRLYVSVGPGGAPAADFEIESLTAVRSGDDIPVVSATVRNTGGRALDMKGTLELTNGPGGLTAGPFPAELGSTLGIGDTQSVHMTLDTRLPDGPWDAAAGALLALVAAVGWWIRGRRPRVKPKYLQTSPARRSGAVGILTR